MALLDEVRRILESRPTAPPRTDFERRNTDNGLVRELMRAINDERSAVLAVCDELDERYINGDGKPITNDYQQGKCAGYSLAAHMVRRALSGANEKVL